MEILEILYTLFTMLIVGTATEVVHLPFQDCESGATAMFVRVHTLDGWLGAAWMAGALHLLVRKTRLSTWRHADAALVVATLVLLVAAPFIAAHGGLQKHNLAVAMGGGVTIYHVMSWMGALGLVGFAGLFAYRLEGKAKVAAVAAGVAVALGLYVGFPAGALPEQEPPPRPAPSIGHSVCDVNPYGF